jgi:superfamily II DNA or RNA helicase
MTPVNGRRWRPGSHVRVRGRRWRVDDVTAGADCVALRLTDLETAPPRTLTVLSPFDRLAAIHTSHAIKVLRPRRWLHELNRALVEVRPFGSLAGTARSGIRLLPHQLEPALATLRYGAMRLLIADAVGLGKTIQAGIILHDLSLGTDSFRGVVLVPAGLREQWSAELLSHFGLASVVADASWLQASASDHPQGINPWSVPGIYISSHDFVKRPEALLPLEEVSWDVVVVDEAHAAGSGTDRRAAIDAIACRSVRVVLLTATPDAGDPAALGALCRIGRTPDSEAPITMFARSRHDVDARQPRRSTVLAVRLSEAERRMHELLRHYAGLVWSEAVVRNDDRAKLASIVLRKRALSSAGSLVTSVLRRIDLLSQPPADGHQQLRLPLADEDPLADEEPLDALSAPGLADASRERRWLTAIAEAGRLAARAESKTRLLLRLLRRVRQPIIVFTEYRDTLARLEQRLRATGRAILTLHGGQNPSERHGVATLFNQGEHVLLATDAAAEGLNLQRRCRMVVHYELPWNPSRLEQRAGRVDRLGQRERVHELALVAADTAETLVVAPLLARARRSRQSAAGLRMLDALSDSRVADAVMSGANVDVVDVDASPATITDAIQLVLDHEAAEEAERLSEERRLTARSNANGRHAEPGRPIATAFRRRYGSTQPARGSILVYLCTIECESGRRLHAETVTVRVTAEAPRQPPTALILRRDLQPLVEPVDRSLATLLETWRSKTLDRVAALHSRVQAARSDRIAALAKVRESAARRLVQPGLFGHDHGGHGGNRATEHTEYTDQDSGKPLHAATVLLAAIRIDSSGRS